MLNLCDRATSTQMRVHTSSAKTTQVCLFVLLLCFGAFRRDPQFVKNGDVARSRHQNTTTTSQVTRKYASFADQYISNTRALSRLQSFNSNRVQMASSSTRQAQAQRHSLQRTEKSKFVRFCAIQHATEPNQQNVK